jgi:hypothetical protein
MSGKTIGDPNSLVGQYYDVDVLSASGSTPGTSTPTSTVQKFWSGVFVTGAGNLVVDTLGVNGQNPKTSQTISLPAGATLQLACTKVYSSTTCTGVTALY